MAWICGTTNCRTCDTSSPLSCRNRFCSRAASRRTSPTRGRGRARPQTSAPTRPPTRLALRRGRTTQTHAEKAMSGLARLEVLPANLLDHRVVKAWRQVAGECCEPENVDVLKLKTKTAVYRLTGSGPGAFRLIAK